jgi:long-subunit acyl-CoA synthetase (AMP-forming)
MNDLILYVYFLVVYQSFTVAVIVPDTDILEKYAREKNISGDITELCKKKVRSIVVFFV